MFYGSRIGLGYKNFGSDRIGIFYRSPIGFGYTNFGLACFINLGSDSDTKISDRTGSACFIDLGWIGFGSDFLNDNSIIITNQPSGFRPLHSTQTTVLQSANQCLVNMDDGLINDFLFLDLKNAFDTVDHKILLSKLERYGIRRTASNLFSSIFIAPNY